jgi:hypothetical protein
VRVCPELKREHLLLSFDGGGIFQFSGAITKSQEFGIRHMIPPGIYEVTLRQVMVKHGGIAVTLDKATQSAVMTGWQIFSKTYQHGFSAGPIHSAICSL